eukprot:gnl/Dysnectes_brevis/1635_a1860_3060.p1 GENE.gnl/Dysnectes_brevis/1635_a1860_3060~~gnl/Dysnectes_brevis/1635_a1860_3060.p1  ORF type:complete len:221 (+),score=13.40 gnl/Dysnectes_brevis/1635_a1860_3060:45-707(+)
MEDFSDYPKMGEFFNRGVLDDCLLIITFDFIVRLIIAFISHNWKLSKKKARLMAIDKEATILADQITQHPDTAQHVHQNLQKLIQERNQLKPEFEKEHEQYENRNPSIGHRMMPTVLSYGFSKFINNVFLKSMRGKTYVFRFPDGVIKPGILARILAIGTKADAGAVGLFFISRLFSPLSKKLAVFIFPPYSKPLSLRDRLQKQLGGLPQMLAQAGMARQ